MPQSANGASAAVATPRTGSPPADRHAVSVRHCLQAPPLDEATVVAGGAGLDARRVRWMTVIEGPVDDFVSPGDFVLSTGLDQGPEQLRELVADVADSGAAALAVAVGGDGPIETVPDDARALADRHGMPLLELPWAVRFADVLRALTDRLLSARYAATLDAGDQLPADFADALLTRRGLEAIAAATEALVDRPVLILDACLAVTARGPLAQRRLGDAALAAQPEAAHALEPATLAGLCNARDDDTVRWVGPCPEARLPAGLSAPAVAQGSTLGYVLAVDEEGPREPLIVERHALAHAALAVAIEMLRRRAVAEAEARARGDFLWELASGTSLSDEDLTTRAVLLGYAVGCAYRVLVARAETASEAQLDEVARRMHRQGGLAGLQASRRGDRVLVLVPEDAPPQLRPEALAREAGRAAGPGACSWGIAEGAYLLRDVADGVRHAERALRVGRALHGEATVADADALGPFLMLDALAGDEAAQRSAAEVLAPLEAYDEDTARGLVETLETFLRENGNTSSAARALFLNRHSLMYRLRKIEALTGRSLDRHDDRFIFELSIRLRRMAAS
jgi:PucR family transcriptional regulator, purine catabolism regulatory protein